MLSNSPLWQMPGNSGLRAVQISGMFDSVALIFVGQARAATGYAK
jgi:hypothetical protein